METQCAREGAGGDVGGALSGGVSLLLLGEFQRVAEDLESLLFITVSTCLGRLTADIEHLPAKSTKNRTHKQC